MLSHHISSHPITSHHITSHPLTSLPAYLTGAERKTVEALSGSDRGSAGASSHSRPRVRARGRGSGLGAPPPDTSVCVAGPLERRMEQEQATLKWSIQVATRASRNSRNVESLSSTSGSPRVPCSVQISAGMTDSCMNYI